mmetsp:Transcript_16710/g.18921  ORF Transcript_16710/g.18921 Transcript_16710/m.18921 type:complete len:86 (+) Transcript_16710:28-285(+)
MDIENVDVSAAIDTNPDSNSAITVGLCLRREKSVSFSFDASALPNNVWILEVLNVVNASLFVWRLWVVPKFEIKRDPFNSGKTSV